MRDPHSLRLLQGAFDVLAISPGTSRRSLLLAALALPWGIPGGCGGDGAEPDVRELERLMSGYVAALNRRDAAELSRLLGSNHDPAQITVRLDRFGGRGLHDVRIAHQREAAHLYVVFVSALAGSVNRPFEVREIAFWRRDRWRLTPWPRALVRSP